MTYLYDRIINVTFTNMRDTEIMPSGVPSNVTTSASSIRNPYGTQLKRTFSINCSTQGIKPDITFSFSLIPGNSVYNLKLSIRNFCINNKCVNIRNFTNLIVEAGYQGIGARGSNRKNTITMPCTIFSSYQESPGPDGITVFECVTVSELTGFLNNDYIDIVFNENEVTVREYITRCVRFAGGGKDDGKGNIEKEGKLIVHNYLKENYLDYKIKVEKGTTRVANGYALIQQMTYTLKEWGEDIQIREVDCITKEIKTIPLKIFVSIAKDDIYIMALDPIYNKAIDENTKTKEEIIDLRAVTNASFSGPALTVTAPWNPKLLPEKLFVMPPNFINGSNLPNLVEDIYKNANNYYRVLTIDIKFSTVGNENQMTVLAIPTQYLDKETAEASVSQNMYDRASKILKSSTTLSFGNKERSSASYDENKTPMENMRAMADTIANLGGPDYEIHLHDTLTSIAKNFYKNVELVFTKEDLQKIHGNVNWRPRELSTKNGGNTYTCGSEMLWPLIALATIPKARISDEYLDVIQNFDPDVIQVTKKVVIPSISGLKDVKDQKDVFKWAWKWYINSPETSSYARKFRDIYWCLGGTDVN